MEVQAKILGIWIHEFKPCLIADFSFGWLLNVGAKGDGRLAVLTERSDHSWNWLKQSWIASKSDGSGLEKIIRSSTNIRWDIEGQFLATSMPLRSPSNSFCKINLDKTSIAIVKRKGDSESPCRRPWLELKKSAGDPLMRIEKVGVDIHGSMRWIHLSETCIHDVTNS